MHREDFIKKAVRDFVRILHRVMGLKDVYRYDDALASIDAAREEILGLNATLAHHLPARDLVDMVTVGEIVDIRRLLVLAESLKLEGDIYADLGNAKKRDALYTKALEIHLEIADVAEQGKFPDEFTSLETLHSLIETELPQETHANLLFHYEAAGHYHLAAATLFDFLEDYPEEGMMVEEGRAFFERLR